MVDAIQPAAPTEPTGDKPAATNSDGSGKPQAQTEEEVVTLTKAEADELRAKAARTERAESLQSQADKRARQARSDARRAQAKLRVASPNKAGDGGAEGSDDLAIAEQAEIERDAIQGIMQLGFEPKYSELLRSDDTLRQILSDNPLALIKGEVMDAEEAVDQVRENLDVRLEKLQAGKANPEDKPATNIAPSTRPATAAPSDPKSMTTEQLRSWISEDPRRWEKLDDAQRLALKSQTITVKR